MDALTTACLGKKKLKAGQPTIEDVFSTYTYTGNGYSGHRIVNGVNMLGTPADAASATVEASFSSYTYTGNGSAQTITNGIDLATDGGLVWDKSRVLHAGVENHSLFDTERGTSKSLITNGVLAETTGTATQGVTAFNTDGFDFGTSLTGENLGTDHVVWTFKKQAKFFDIVTYTGDGVAGRQIAHNLGTDVGMLIIKSRTVAGNYWIVWHRSVNGGDAYMYLNTTAAYTADGGVVFGNGSVHINPTSTEFTISANAGVNATGDDYVAYLFAHDAAADGIIQCGSYTGSGVANQDITLGWEAQYVMIKDSSAANNWIVIDNQRGSDRAIMPQDSAAEDVYAGTGIGFTATGFRLLSTDADINSTSGTNTYIYMAIRKPTYTDGGGMTWLKSRSLAEAHQLFDTERGAGKRIYSSSTVAETTDLTSLSNFNTDGFTIGTNNISNTNASTNTSWTFKKQPKFFDVVTWSGNSVAGRTIPHNLGTDVGMIIVKSTNYDGGVGWMVYHRSADAINPSHKYLKLNTTDAVADTALIPWNDTEPTSTEFTVSSYVGVNETGKDYVAYLFAHNATDGLVDGDGTPVIKCGSYTGNGADQDIDLGFEPQWMLVKASTYVSGADDWWIIDSIRGVTALSTNNNNYLRPNLSNAEGTSTGIEFTSTGFKSVGGGILDDSTYIYLAIARGMKTPTTSSEVFAIDDGGAGSANPEYISGFTVDMTLEKAKAGGGTVVASRLMQGKYLDSTGTSAEITWANAQFDYNNGWCDTARSYVSWMFKRATGFFDVVCYTGDGVAGRTVNHNLGVVPEMMWVKCRSTASSNWRVYHSATTETDILTLNDALATTASSSTWNNTVPSDNVFTVGTDWMVNSSGQTYIAYLFATLDGVSKVGSYTGNGTSQTIDCGFTTGAKFVLIKQIDNGGGHWYLWDSARGIVAGNDPYLKLNTTDAEVTALDDIDPDNSGFIINQNSSSINFSGYNYIYYSIAN